LRSKDRVGRPAIDGSSELADAFDGEPVDLVEGAWDDCCARAIEAERPIAASDELKTNLGRRKPRLLAG
jgi:hypothetical protein